MRKDSVSSGEAPRRRAGRLLAVGLAAIGCSSPGSIDLIQSEIRSGEDFSGYRRYAWMPASETRSGTQPEDHRLHDVIHDAVEEVLRQRGFVAVPGAGADFLVTYHCKVKEELQVEVIDRVWYDDPEGGEWTGVPRRIERSSFERGSIVIDLVSPRDGRRVWRGVARGRLSPDATPDQLRQIVDRSVREILDAFPPGG